MHNAENVLHGQWYNVLQFLIQVQSLETIPKAILDMTLPFLTFNLFLDFQSAASMQDEKWSQSAIQKKQHRQCNYRLDKREYDVAALHHIYMHMSSKLQQTSASLNVDAQMLCTPDAHILYFVAVHQEMDRTRCETLIRSIAW